MRATHARDLSEALQNRDFARARDELIADITTTQDVLRPLCPE